MKIENNCYGFIGLGLIGGSIAKALKQYSPQTRIIAYNRTTSVLERACEEQIVDLACEEVDERFAECDYIFLCLPVSYNVQYLKRLSTIVKKNCIITDAGSVKTDIHREVSKLGMAAQFIGGHPMAGSDKTGYEHSTADLLTNACYIITPSEQSSPEALQEYYDLVKQLGAIPLILGYEEHDSMTANISHVPHIIAASLANLIQDHDNEQQVLKKIAAGGFKDTTRIAAGSPVMWQQICMTNSEAICHVLDAYIDELKQIRGLVASHSSEEIYQFFKKAQTYRNEFN
ncbi:MAG: prephenate dehydrogenase/arogenate dehydrogenase family protein [Lachnospiraceae bacterium]|nr:prephenate dehydrogenase/arogenate dehydrogenase family protein [Lachnospiraceae bacterium]